jgi:chemotaxis protein MotB
VQQSSDENLRSLALPDERYAGRRQTGRARLAKAAAALAGVFVVAMLSACVSQQQYEQQTRQLQQTEAQVQSQQQQIAKMEAQQKWVVAGDLLFPPGGYQLSAGGKQALEQYVPQLQALQNAKIVIYGHTDNKPVGTTLKRKGIDNNLDLSSKRAANVVAYLVSQGVNPKTISAKGFGDTHPLAPNDTNQGRAENRRIEIVVEGPGA